MTKKRVVFLGKGASHFVNIALLMGAESQCRDQDDEEGTESHARVHTLPTGTSVDAEVLPDGTLVDFPPFDLHRVLVNNQHCVHFLTTPMLEEFETQLREHVGPIFEVGASSSFLASYVLSASRRTPVIGHHFGHQEGSYNAFTNKRSTLAASIIIQLTEYQNNFSLVFSRIQAREPMQRLRRFFSLASDERFARLEILKVAAALFVIGDMRKEDVVAVVAGAPMWFKVVTNTNQNGWKPSTWEGPSKLIPYADLISPLMIQPRIRFTYGPQFRVHGERNDVASSDPHNFPPWITARLAVQQQLCAYEKNGNLDEVVVEAPSLLLRDADWLLTNQAFAHEILAGADVLVSCIEAGRGFEAGDEKRLINSPLAVRADSTVFRLYSEEQADDDHFLCRSEAKFPSLGPAEYVVSPLQYYRERWGCCATGVVLEPTSPNFAALGFKHCGMDGFLHQLMTEILSPGQAPGIPGEAITQPVSLTPSDEDCGANASSISTPFSLADPRIYVRDVDLEKEHLQSQSYIPGLGLGVKHMKFESPTVGLRCSACDEPLVDRANKFCISCGASVSHGPHVCLKCSRVLGGQDRFCGGCGTKRDSTPAARAVSEADFGQGRSNADTLWPIFNTIKCLTREEIVNRMRACNAFFQQHKVTPYTLTGDALTDLTAREKARATGQVSGGPPHRDEVGIGFCVYNVGRVDMVRHTFFGQFRMVTKWYCPNLDIPWDRSSNRTVVPLNAEDFKVLYLIAVSLEAKKKRWSDEQVEKNWVEAEKNRWPEKWVEFLAALRVPNFTINTTAEYITHQRNAYVDETEDHPLVVTIETFLEAEFVIDDSTSRSSLFDPQNLDVKVRMWDSQDKRKRFFTQIVWPYNTHFLYPLRMTTSRPEFIQGVPHFRCCNEVELSGDRNKGASVYVISLVAKRTATFYMSLLEFLIVPVLMGAGWWLGEADRSMVFLLLSVVAKRFTTEPNLPRGWILISDIFVLACMIILCARVLLGWLVLSPPGLPL